MNKCTKVGVFGSLKISMYLGYLWKMKLEGKLGFLWMDLNPQQWIIFSFIGIG